MSIFDIFAKLEQEQKNKSYSRKSKNADRIFFPCHLFVFVDLHYLIYKVFTGCNVENAAFTPTCCAERVALFKAISEGEREFKKIAVAGGKSGNIGSVCTPCGVCRQALSEFCKADFKIICAGNDEVKTFTLSELLPHSFSSEDVL